jgi:hypothetical protein
MPRTVVFQSSLAGIITPAERPEEAKQDAVAWGASLTVNAGDMVAVKAADKLCYPYAVGGAGGLGVAVAISMYSFKTGTDGKPILNADSVTPDYLHIPNHTAPIWQRGTFELADFKIAGVAATEAEVRTAFGTDRIVTEPNGFLRII